MRQPVGRYILLLALEVHTLCRPDGHAAQGGQVRLNSTIAVIAQYKTPGPSTYVDGEGSLSDVLLLLWLSVRRDMR